MLERLEAAGRQLLALAQLRQGRALLLLPALVLAVIVDGLVAGEAELAGAGAEAMGPGGDGDAEAVVARVLHLTRHEAVPDEAVELILVRCQVRAHALRRQEHIAGADGLVGVLGPGLRLVLPRLLRRIVVAEAVPDQLVRVPLGLGADAQGVRSHIGDEAHGALAGDVHALVELLGHGHGAPRRHVQLIGRLLLHGGGGEGGRGGALLSGALDAVHPEGQAAQLLLDGLHLGLGLRLGLLAVPAIVGRLEGLAARGLQHGVQRPVFLGLEFADLAVPVIHHAGGNALDAARREATADLLPHDR